MKIISHRGNIKGSIPEKENRPSYIDCAIGNGYDVEIDVRTINGELWLGHDEPQYKVIHTWLKCWKYQSFCHTSDPYIYTSTGKIWLHDLSMVIDDDVIIPLIDDPVWSGNSPYAICTDYPILL